MPVKIKSQAAGYKSQVKIKSLHVLIFCVLAFNLYLVSCVLQPACGAPSYGTRLPQKHKISLGVEGYTVFKRYLEDDYGKLRSRQYFLDLSFGIFDWLALDLKGGLGNIKQHPPGSDEIDYPTYLGGGYGLRWQFYDAHRIKTVLGFQHISIHPHTIFIGSTKHKAVLDDWQFSLLASYSFSRLTPYLGTRWSRLDYLHWTNGERNRVKSDSGKSVGLIAGFDLPLGKRLWINLEGSFFDSEAASLSLNYSF
jgi:hypothetical protein